jgi:hypothetical protein
MILGIEGITRAFLTPDNREGKRGWPVMIGSALLLFGGFFFTFTLDLFTWSEQGRLWPFYLLIIALSAFIGYIASGLRGNGLLIAGLVFGIAGAGLLVASLSGFLYDFDWVWRYDIDEWFVGGWAGVWWPVFPMAVGAVLVLIAISVPNPRIKSGLVFVGTLPLLMGTLFLLTTLDVISWGDQGVLWPVYPLIVGVAALAVYFVSNGTLRGFLYTASICGGVGLVFLLTNLINDSLAGSIWPVLLIIVGLFLLVPALRGRSQGSLR